MSASTSPARVSSGLRPFFGRDMWSALRQEIDDVLGRFPFDGAEGWLAGPKAPSLDLSETNESLQLKVDVPGMKPEEIEVEVANNTLRIHGERKEEREEKGKTYHRIERHTGSFSRVVALPCPVQENKIQAEYRDGVLSILLPKAEEAKAHKIKVAAK